MSRHPLARIAGPIALGTGARAPRPAARSWSRSSIAARSRPRWPTRLFVPARGRSYFVAFCGAARDARRGLQPGRPRKPARSALVGFLAALDRHDVPRRRPVVRGIRRAVAGRCRAGLRCTSPAGCCSYGAFTSYVLFAVGWVLYGRASVRARCLPAADLGRDHRRRRHRVPGRPPSPVRDPAGHRGRVARHLDGPLGCRRPHRPGERPNRSLSRIDNPSPLAGIPASGDCASCARSRPRRPRRSRLRPPSARPGSFRPGRDCRRTLG